MRKKTILTFAIACLFGLPQISVLAKAENNYKEPAFKNVKNVIIMIGDGMGPNQVKAGEIYKGEQLAISKMSQTTYSETCSANNMVTDSAAGGTAIATGVRTNNYRVGIDPSGEDLTTILDVALEQGKRTGIVTTDVLSGATPMSFSAHSFDRVLTDELYASAANSGVNLFAACGGDIDEFTDQNGNVYTNVTNVADISECQSNYVIGDYNMIAGVPSMSSDASTGVAFDRVVSEALEYLSQDPDGFVLMAEGAKIDKAGHNSNFTQMLGEMLAFDDAVKAVMDWADNRDDTVIIVTADHETGGLLLGAGATKDNLMSSYQWTSNGSHTSTDVYCKVYGVDVDFARYSSFGTSDRVKNIDIFKMAQSFLLGRQKVEVEDMSSITLYGKIEFDKTEYFYGEKLIIQATPKTNCELTSLKINGVEMISLVENNRLEYEINAAQVQVLPTFKKVKTPPEITYEDLGDQGTYELSPNSVNFGEKLIVKINPSAGYEIEQVYFGGVEMTKTADNTYEITPETSGMVRVIFKTVENVDGTTNEDGGCKSAMECSLILPLVALGTLCFLKKKSTKE